MAGFFSGGRKESELTALIIGHATRGEAYNLTIEAIPRGPDDDSLVAALMAGVAVHVPVKARDTSDTPTNVTMIVLDLDGPDPSSAFINIQLELSPPMLMVRRAPCCCLHCICLRCFDFSGVGVGLGWWVLFSR